MKRILPLLICCITFNLILTSCKKDAKVAPVNTSPTTIGLYQYEQDTAKRVFIIVSKVGTVSKSYFSVFDTGSSGMTLDAHGILPSAMITSTGLQVTGDSVVVNGITVTSKRDSIAYGDKTSSTKEYGNLAYASVTIGDQNGNISSKRVPIFIYYKVVDGNGKEIVADHSLDVFGVGPSVDLRNTNLNSPLRYFNSSSGATSGFKLALLKSGNFTTTNPTYVAGLLTVGLSASDLSSSSGFIMHPLNADGSGGYSPNIPATISYNGRSVAAQVLFDTGTPTFSIIEDKLATASIGPLPANTTVTITTNQGFTYTYITRNTSNLTAVENPNRTGDFRTIFSIDFFIENEYLTDYTNHQIGLKNN